MDSLFYVVECLAFRFRQNLRPLILRVHVSVQSFSSALEVHHWYKIWRVYPDGELLVARRSEV